jgi:hypothetical protein
MTYKVTGEVPHEINNGGNIARLTLADEYGGRFHIIVDDHCYVLMCEREGKCTASSHWFAEAILALRQLPLDPDEAPTPPTIRLIH